MWATGTKLTHPLWRVVWSNALSQDAWFSCTMRCSTKGNRIWDLNVSEKLALIDPPCLEHSIWRWTTYTTRFVSSRFPSCFILAYHTESSGLKRHC